MNEQILVIKGENATYSQDYVKEVFEKSDDLNLIKSVVEKAKDRLYVSWASVDAKDKAGERIPIEDIIRGQNKLMKRNAPIMDSHSNVHIGQTLAYKILQHPKTKTMGVLHLNKIFNDSLKDDEVWSKIKSGEYTGSSVGGYSIGSEYESYGGSLVKRINGFTQFETSAVKEPCNQFALNESVSVVAKSKEGVNTQMGQIKETKKESKEVLKSIYEKMEDGEALSPEEQKALEVAITAVESVLTGNPEEVTAPEEQPVEDNSEEEMKEEVVEPTAEEPVVSEDPIIKQILDRLDAIEESISGGINKEETMDGEEPKQPEDETEKEDNTEVQKELESTKKELDKVSKELAEVKKKYEVVEVVKSERPSVVNVNKSKLIPTAGDIALGKAKKNKVTGEYTWKN